MALVTGKDDLASAIAKFFGDDAGQYQFRGYHLQVHWPFQGPADRCCEGHSAPVGQLLNPLP
jgi:hypothetical protein